MCVCVPIYDARVVNLDENVFLSVVSRVVINNDRKFNMETCYELLRARVFVLCYFFFSAHH